MKDIDEMTQNLGKDVVDELRREASVQFLKSSTELLRASMEITNPDYVSDEAEQRSVDDAMIVGIESIALVRDIVEPQVNHEHARTRAYFLAENDAFRQHSDHYWNQALQIEQELLRH